MPNSTTIDERYTPERTDEVVVICRKCKQTKPIIEFAKDTGTKSGYRRLCLECTRAENKRRYDGGDPIKRREAMRRWQDKNRDYVNAYARKRRNPDEPFVPKGRPARFLSYQESLQASNQYYHTNGTRIRPYRNQRNQRPDVKAKRAALEMRRVKTNLHHRIKRSLARRIRCALKDGCKSARTIDLVGCDITFFQKWIEHQFWNGMSWGNYSLKGWHIDHIRPCASFDLTNPEEQRKCFHWTNLQPLWSTHNASKRHTIIPTLDYQI